MKNTHLTPLVPFVDFSGSDQKRLRLTVNLTHEAHEIVRAHCDAKGLHYMVFYRGCFDLGLRDVLVAAGALTGLIENRLPSGAITGGSRPVDANAPRTTLQDDREALQAAAEAYRSRRE